MESVRVDFECDQGSVWGRTIVFYTDVAGTTPLDLTGYTGSFRIATAYDAAEPLIELTIGSGLTVTTPANGTMGIRLTPEQTALLPSIGPGSGKRLVYSLELTDDDDVVEEKFYGAFDVKPKVPA